MATLVLLPALIQLGMWQYGKARQKLALQQRFEAMAKARPLWLDGRALESGDMRYRRVAARGRYEPGYGILLDNQVHQGMAGYHVITPFHISGSGLRVLVDRGWVPVGGDRRILPAIDTPAEETEITGFAWLPPEKVFTLAPDPPQTGWRMVWQNLDMARYRAAVPFPVEPFVVRLDPGVAGGYVRDWPPPGDRREMHMVYALQWFGMAGALGVIYVVVNFRKEEEG